MNAGGMTAGGTGTGTGMGAVPGPDGSTTFRVWAPNASAVVVCLVDDGGSPGEPHGLDSTGDGYWATAIVGVGAGARYLYRIQGPEGELTKRDPYSRFVTNSVGVSVVYDESAFEWHDTDYRTPPWDDLVIYELHIGTFAPAPDGSVGDLRTAAARLPYLRELGISAVELLPLAEFAGDRSWGYNPAYPFAVEEAYGGPDALKEFVQAAHDLGIAVIVDVVYNHFGPSDLDLWRFDGWHETDAGGGIYFYEDDRAESGWGPRPNYGRSEVRQLIRDNAQSWLHDYHVNGLRLDATASIRSRDGSAAPWTDIAEGWQLLREINGDTDATGAGRLVIAEDMRGSDAITTGTSEGGAGFGSQWDPDFVTALRHAVVAVDDSQRDVGAVAAAVARTYSGRALARVVFTESHDADANGGARVPQEIDPGQADSLVAKKRSTLAAAVALTSPGIPMLFQGQEILENLWFDDSHPVDWSKQESHAGILALYRDLIALRRNASGATGGLRGAGVRVHHVNTEGRVIAYHRWNDATPGQDVVVVANFSAQTAEGYAVGLPYEGTWWVRFNSDWTGYDSGFGNHPTPDVAAGADARDGMPASGAVGIGAYAVVILSKDS